MWAVGLSQRVDPQEIVRFVSNMGKRVNTGRFWKLFNDLDLDNSADLDIDEFIGVMDALTQVRDCLAPNAGPKQRGSVDSVAHLTCKTA